MAISRQNDLSTMVAQSRDVITNPSVATFERYEKRGSIGTAGVYVLVTALVAGVIGFLTALILGGNPFGALVGGVASALVNFVIFTGLVYYIGRNMAGGTGSWDEVAYSFALFIAPFAVISGLLSLIVALLGWIPILGALVGLGVGIGAIVVLLAQVYFGFLAVQSSMNIRDAGRAAMVLGLAFVGTLAAQLLLGAIGGLLGGLLPLILLVALVAVVASMVMRRRGRR
jgi:hypothetical protein